MSQNWNERLKAEYTQKVKTLGGAWHRPVRLPDDASMRVTGEGDHATIELRADAVGRNMQENAVAFEGWSLALRFWCGAEKVTLKWQPQDPPPSPNGRLTPGQRHYQRFLYRVERFASLFDWFDIAVSDAFAHSLVGPHKVLYLNVAGRPTDRPLVRRDGAQKASPEHDLERRLLDDDDFDRQFGFGDGSQKDCQFPVGLFSQPKPTAATAVFPGGKGAIDLVCLDSNRLWLFELKAKKNIPIGTITELLFYTSVMRDFRMNKFDISVGDGRPSRAKFSPHEIKKIDAITGAMLGHDLHPLLATPGLLQLLNDAVGATWNQEAGAPAVSFRAARIIDDSPFTISET